jgi:hypothetical protein
VEGIDFCVFPVGGHEVYISVGWVDYAHRITVETIRPGKKTRGPLVHLRYAYVDDDELQFQGDDVLAKQWREAVELGLERYWEESEWASDVLEEADEEVELGGDQ